MQLVCFLFVYFFAKERKKALMLLFDPLVNGSESGTLLLF